MLRELATAQNLILVDLAAWVAELGPSDPGPIFDDVHWTAETMHLKAERIGRALLEADPLRQTARKQGE